MPVLLAVVTLPLVMPTSPIVLWPLMPVLPVPPVWTLVLSRTTSPPLLFALMPSDLLLSVVIVPELIVIRLLALASMPVEFEPVVAIEALVRLTEPI
jgi:hypothetical protein